MSARSAAVAAAAALVVAAAPAAAEYAPCGFHMTSTNLYVFCADVVYEEICYTYPHCST